MATRTKWTKALVISEIQRVKTEEGHVHRSYLRKNHDKIRGAIERLFESFDEAIKEAGFDPMAEKGDCGSGFRGQKHSNQTKQLLSDKMQGKYSGNLNPMYGKTHTESSKEKISKKRKEWLADHPDWQSGDRNCMFGKNHTLESNAKRSESLKKYNSQFEKRPYCLTKQGRKRIQEARAKAISKQKSSFTDIEIIVRSILDELYIEYEFQYNYPYFCVDFYLPQYDCVVWCDGDYWHANPTSCKNVTARQKTQRRLDKSQESYLSNRGIRFLRLWGSDIKNKTFRCKDLILELIKEID